MYIYRYALCSQYFVNTYIHMQVVYISIVYVYSILQYIQICIRQIYCIDILPIICTIQKLITVYITLIITTVVYTHLPYYCYYYIYILYTSYTLLYNIYTIYPLFSHTYRVHFIYIIYILYHTVFISYKLLINTLMYTRLYTQHLT